MVEDPPDSIILALVYSMSYLLAGSAFCRRYSSPKYKWRITLMFLADM